MSWKKAFLIKKACIKSKADVTFKDAVEMFKNDIKTLKEHIHIKRKHVNTYHETKTSLSENDLILRVDCAKSYKNDQQDAMQSAYLENICFSCKYTPQIYSVSLY